MYVILFYFLLIIFVKLILFVCFLPFLCTGPLFWGPFPFLKEWGGSSRDKNNVCLCALCELSNHVDKFLLNAVGKLRQCGRIIHPPPAPLTLILLTWTIWRAPTNASKWRMGFNSAFKGLTPTVTNNKMADVSNRGKLHQRNILQDPAMIQGRSESCWQNGRI